MNAYMLNKDEALGEAVARLGKLAGVTKVVPGAYSAKRHRHAPGEARLVSRAGLAASVRVYASGGMQNVHVYADDLDRLAALLAKGAADAPVAKVTRRATRNSGQPVYPATPAPMKPADVVAGTPVSGTLVEVTPDVACNWLERNLKNRHLRDADVKKYASDMRAGRWLAGGAVIKFDTDGNIVNGQHVLWAVIESGVTVPVFVLSGLDPEVFLVEDDHARRSIMDVVRIAQPGRAFGTVHSGTASMLRQSIDWVQGRLAKTAWTRQEQVAFIEEHHDAVQYAVSAFGGTGHGQGGGNTKRGILVAPVIAVVARAYYGQDREQVARFARVLTTGLVEDVRENTAVLLRNWLLAGVGTRTATMEIRKDTYLRAERALRGFLDGEHLKQLKPCAEEQFLLPGEKARKKK